MEQINISRWQLFLIVFQATIGTSFVILPSVTIESAKQAAWIIPIFIGMVGILVSLLWLYLSRQHPGLSLVQITMAAMGRWGWPVALLYVWFFLHVSAWASMNLGDIVNVTLLPETPRFTFQIVFLLIAAYAIVQGFETVARTIEFFVPVMFIAFITMGLFSLKEWDWTQFRPLLMSDAVHGMMKSGSVIAFPFMEMVCLLMVTPYVKAKAGRTLIYGLAGASITFSLITCLIIGVLGTTRATHITYPIYKIAQEMQISEFIEHLEAIVSIFWLLSIFIKLVLFFYCGVIGLCQLFRVKHRSVIALPLAIYIPALSNSFFHNVIENMEWSARNNLAYDSIFAVVLPLLLLAVTKIKGRMGGR